MIEYLKCNITNVAFFSVRFLTVRFDSKIFSTLLNPNTLLVSSNNENQSIFEKTLINRFKNLYFVHGLSRNINKKRY